jgi:hypothetical protein
MPGTPQSQGSSAASGYSAASAAAPPSPGQWRGGSGHFIDTAAPGPAPNPAPDRGPHEASAYIGGLPTLCARCEGWGHHSLSLNCPRLPDDLRYARSEVRTGILRGQVDINTADLDLLKTVRDPIGPKRAEDILRYRALNGQFTSAMQLTRLSGRSHTLVSRVIGRIRMSVRDRSGVVTHYVAATASSPPRPTRPTLWT